MEEPRAKHDDAVSVALSSLDRRITDGLKNLDIRCDARFKQLETEMRSVELVANEKFVRHSSLMGAQAEKEALALAASEKAIDKAEASTDRRFASVNEFRAALTEQAASFMPRPEYDAGHTILTELVDNLRTQLADHSKLLLPRVEFDSRSKTIDARMAEINQRFAAIDGQRQGSQNTREGWQANTAWIVAVIGVIVLAVNFYFSHRGPQAPATKPVIVQVPKTTTTP